MTPSPWYNDEYGRTPFFLRPGQRHPAFWRGYDDAVANRPMEEPDPESIFGNDAYIDGWYAGMAGKN